ncbi:DUF4865 family protein [Clostridium boliviensis]|uniref:DUF4865 family protein n=1 Tax=Clostridium boliviensis TaxID=318465 RepID=A0ABU4GGN5_9CLOT|nr:DUF4865 family protein [Clostridium boliviensis]MDW2796108.1 DUF4865 family protein [Clostridium boliviensis]
MIGMQYEVTLPVDYDMNIIRKRVAENGSKTDGFPGLKYKCYLIREKGVDGFEQVYAPLYLWNQEEGMNHFLFGGYYDQIIKSFGWQHVNIGIPLFHYFNDPFLSSRYVTETTGSISPELSLSNIPEKIRRMADGEMDITGQVCIYNPDKWRYSLFSFMKDRPQNIKDRKIYQILHISEGKEI